MFASKIRSCKRHADHRNKPCDTVHVVHVSVLDIEPRGFHSYKELIESFPQAVQADKTELSVEILLW